MAPATEPLSELHSLVDVPLCAISIFRYPSVLHNYQRKSKLEDSRFLFQSVVIMLIIREHEVSDHRVDIVIYFLSLGKEMYWMGTQVTLFDNRL